MFLIRGGIPYKKNVIQECRGFFESRSFEYDLNEKGNLIGFKNGVFDINKGIEFKNEITDIGFRDGSPDDCIKFSTNCNYKPYNKDDIIVKEINDYILMKYNKESLTIENEKTLGLFRSVIVKNDKLVCFAPQKAINFNNFITDNEFDECEITEFIPGTMVNIFYDEKSDEEIKWQICTRSNIGARCRYNLDTQKTFRDMFFEACNISNFNI